jgi:hypothetical protein
MPYAACELAWWVHGQGLAHPHRFIPAPPRETPNPAPTCPALPADLEETFENLILDQLDVGQYGPSLLDPDFELDHVFD